MQKSENLYSVLIMFALPPLFHLGLCAGDILVLVVFTKMRLLKARLKVNICNISSFNLLQNVSKDCITCDLFKFSTLLQVYFICGYI